MSWKSIAGNQTISRANLQNAIDTGVFIQRNGVPGTETNRQITKANASDYIYTWDLYPPLRDKTSNQLPVKSNLAVQSIQFFGTSDSNNLYLFVGNNNRSWFYRIWTTNLNYIGNFTSIAASNDGHYIIFGRFGGDNGSFFWSNTYGEIFNLGTNVIGLGDTSAGTAVSDNGNLMLVTRQKGSSGGALETKVFVSGDYGITWNVVFTAGYSVGISPEIVVNGAATNGAGTLWVVLGCENTGTASDSYYVIKSNPTSAPSIIFITAGKSSNTQSCIAMSKNGQYMVASPPHPVDIFGQFKSVYFVSNDYGYTWSTINSPVTCIAFNGCSISAGGDYMAVNGYNGTGYFFESTDFGVTWTTKFSFGGNVENVTLDRSGQFQYANFQTGDVFGLLKNSIDYGSSFNQLSLPTGLLNAICVTATTATTPYIFSLLNNVYGTYTPKYTKTTGQSGAQYNNVGGLTAGTYNYIAASGNSNNGKYVATIQDNGTTSILWISSDYGQTWANRFGTSGEMLKVCAISDNGTYILAVTYNSANNTAYIFRSANSGATFQYIYVSQTGIPKNCDMSGDGKYSTILFNDTASTTTRTMSSSDYSATFPTYHFFSGRVAGDICMSNAGRYRTVTMTDTANVSIMWRSTNYGISWDSDSRFSYGFWDYVANDNSGQVQIIGLNATNGIGSVIYTTDRWVTFGSFYTENSELVPQLIGGVNISNDATYWTIVTTDGYSYVSTNAGASWSPTNLGYTNTFKQLSK